MTTIGFGCYAGVPSWAPRYANGQWHQVMDPGATDPFPGRHTLGRVPFPGGDAAEWDLVRQGEAGADKYAQFFRPAWQRASWVAAWQGPNEIQAGELWQADCANRFYVRLCATATAVGVRIGGGVFSRGRPDEHLYTAYNPMLRALATSGGYLVVHEYGMPAGLDAPADRTWHALRYRRWLAPARAAGIPLRIIVGELAPIGTSQDKGYQAFGMTTAEYLRQVAWYAAETQADPEVVGSILFHASSYSFGTFAIGEEIGAGVARINDGLPPVAVGEDKPMVAEIAPHLIWPLAGGAGVITQEFGQDLADYSAYGLIHHNGRDLGAPTGTPIVATHAGQCWCYEDPGGYGNVVEVWAPNRPGGALPYLYKTISAHMQRWCVQDGQMVEPGMVIGYVGTTGNSTGPHLHYGTKLYRNGAVNPGYRDWVDPRPFMER